MKKLLLVLGLGAAGMGYSQCSIVGKSSMKINDTETFSVENDIAQCKECHLWVTIGGNTIPAAGSTENNFSITAKQGGREVISLLMLSPSGVVQCSKNLDITDSSDTKTQKTTDCDIAVTDFKEVKYADKIVSLFPIQTDGANHKFYWSANYVNGEIKTSTEKVPQFTYKKENYIKLLKVKIESGKCIKSLSKNYGANFWSYF